MAQPKIFVSHSHVDDAFATLFVDRLLLSGANAWMDKTDLGAGNFQQRISEALADCEWFVLVLTRDALASPWVRQEVDAANRLKNQGKIHDLIFIQAGPVDHSELPALWGVFNILDATKDYTDALTRTLKAVGLKLWRLEDSPEEDHNQKLPKQLADLGFAMCTKNGIEYIVPPLCDVRAGPFLMGDDKHSATLPAYQIARYPVTVAEYACFVQAGQRQPDDWQKQLAKLDHPVGSVTWHNATAYATWLSERTGQPWRLPSSEEWEKAARGPDGRVYPWGDAFDKVRCNTIESGIGHTTAIGTYPSGAGPYGAQDQAGNVNEWTASLNDTEYRVLRGGSWNSAAWDTRAANLSHNWPDFFTSNFGFRLVVAAHPAG